MNLSKLSRIEFVETVQDYEATLVINGGNADNVVSQTNELLDGIIEDKSSSENLRENALFYKKAAVRINENHVFNKRLYSA